MVGDDALAAGVEGLEDEELEEGAAAGADQAGDGVVAAFAIGPSPRGHFGWLWGRTGLGDGSRLEKAHDMTCYVVVVGWVKLCMGRVDRIGRHS